MSALRLFCSWPSLSWAVDLALRALDLEENLLAHPMMPHAQSSAAESSSEELDLELRLAPPVDDSVESALFRLDLEKRDALKESLSQRLEIRIAEKYAPPEGAPSPRACVEALIIRWGDIFPKGEVYVKGNRPAPSWKDLKGLNTKLKHAIIWRAKKAPSLPKREVRSTQSYLIYIGEAGA